MKFLPILNFFVETLYFENEVSIRYEIQYQHNVTDYIWNFIICVFKHFPFISFQHFLFNVSTCQRIYLKTTNHPRPRYYKYLEGKTLYKHNFLMLTSQNGYGEERF